MRKKMIAMVGAAVLCLGMTVSVFAADYPAGYGAAYGFMCDANGNFLDWEDFEANLDELIEDGEISEDYRDFYVDMFNWCLTNGGGAYGGRGGCCGGRRW